MWIVLLMINKPAYFRQIGRWAISFIHQGQEPFHWQVWPDCCNRAAPHSCSAVFKYSYSLRAAGNIWALREQTLHFPVTFALPSSQQVGLKEHRARAACGRSLPCSKEGKTTDRQLTIQTGTAWAEVFVNCCENEDVSSYWEREFTSYSYRSWE